MAKENKTKYALLGVLSLISGSGYDIKKFCDSSIGHFWNENYGHIYPVLKKMEDEELITKEVKTTERNQSKNVYSITEKGREELQKWIVNPTERNSIRSEVLLKMFFSKDIPTEKIIEKILNIKIECEKCLEEYLEIEKSLSVKKDKIDKKNLVLWLSTVKAGKYNEEANIKWCNDILKMLEEL